ncbi:hypothetical protein [Helicobacter sp. T3_23-1059]
MSVAKNPNHTAFCFWDSSGLDTSLQDMLFAQYDNKSVDCFG